MLDQIAGGRCRRLMVFMPPQHGKSELVPPLPRLHAGPQSGAAADCASHTHELAVSMNRDMQRITMSSYERVFPGTALWSPCRW